MANGLEAFEKCPPVNLRLGQGDRDAKNAAALVGADADRREHGRSRTTPPKRIFS